MENLYFRIGILALALIGIALFSVPVKAQEVQQAAVCDTADQVVELFTAVVEAKTPFNEAVEAVNEKAGKPACGVLIVAAQVEEEVKTLELDDTLYAILRIRIVAVAIPTPMGYQAQAADFVQYVIAPKGPKVVRHDA